MLAAQEKAAQQAAMVKDGRARQMEATWVSKTGEVVARVNARERCVSGLAGGASASASI
jgi:hypothetical protein